MWDQITSVLGPSGGAYIPNEGGLPSSISLVIWGRGGGGGAEISGGSFHYYNGIGSWPDPPAACLP